MEQKELIFRVTKDDCRWDYYKGSGAGGQKRNKTENCCRCTHKASGAVGKSEEGRSKRSNQIKAFRRMAESKKFRDWVKLEVARQDGLIAEAEKYADREIKSSRIKVEIKVDGLWKEESPYGFCPICGEPGVLRERRPNGNDRCAAGHIYPSKEGLLTK